MSFDEIEIEINGKLVAARSWGVGEPTLALHGWLDNSGTFDRMSPFLAQDLGVIAIDLPGHGRSAHSDGRYWFAEGIEVIWKFADKLGLEQVNLMGHSMGTGLSMLAAAVYPERCRRLICIEGFGPWADQDDQAPAVLRRAIEAKWPKEARSYPSKEEMLKRITERGISPEGGRCLIDRVALEKDGQYYFQHDPNLKLPSLARYTESQVRVFLKQISCPILLIQGEGGLKYPGDILEERLKLLPQTQVEVLDGGHHLHLDHPEPVAELIRASLEQT